MPESLAVLEERRQQLYQQLAEIGDTANGDGLGFRPRQRWEEHPGENRNDRNDHEQLNQRESGGPKTARS